MPYYQQTTHIRANVGATTGVPLYDQTYSYGLALPTARRSDTYVILPGATATLVVPANLILDHVTLINVGASDGTPGVEVFVNLKNTGSTQTVGLSLPAPISGYSTGGQLSFDLSTTSGQVNAINVATCTLVHTSASATLSQRVEVVYVGH